MPDALTLAFDAARASLDGADAKARQIIDATTAVVAALQVEGAAKDTQLAADRLLIADLETEVDEAKNEIVTLKERIIDLENGTNPPPPEPPPTDQPPPADQWYVGIRKDINKAGIRVAGMRFDGGGLDYAIWGAGLTDCQYRWLKLKGNNKEATLRISVEDQTAGKYNEDVWIEDAELWGHVPTQAYLDQSPQNMPKPSLVLHCHKRARVRRIKSYGVAPGVGMLCGSDHWYAKGMVNDDVLFEDIDVYDNPGVPRSGGRLEIHTGCRNVVYRNIRLHDAGEEANGPAIFGIGGQSDHWGTKRQIDNLTIDGLTGTVKLKGVRVIAEWSDPARGSFGMGDGLKIINCDVRLAAAHKPLRWIEPSLYFPQGWKPGWVMADCVWPSYGSSRPVKIGANLLTPAEFNALPGVSNVRFI